MPHAPYVSLRSLLWAGTLPCLAAAAAHAQPVPAPVQLPEISVEGQAPSAPAGRADGYKPESVANPKRTEPLRDTPQTIQVIPPQLLEDQGARTVADALRNVPGISLQAGEGGASTETLRLRGFSVNESVMVDGRRDRSSVPSRDVFNLEQIEVTKGSAASYGGRAATGGSVNLVTKAPGLDAAYGGEISLGTADLRRAAIDVNQPLGAAGLETSALRLNLMGEISGVAERDVIENKRFGIAPSFAWGLGTDTRIRFDWVKVRFDNESDYGLPAANGQLQVPIDRSNYYGLKDFNTEQIESDSAAFLVEHDFSSSLSLRNQFSIVDNSVFTIVSPPRAANAAANTVQANATARDRNDRSIINQTDATLRFSTWGLENTMVTGVELAHENFETSNYTRLGGNIIQNLFNPDPNQAAPAGSAFLESAETEVGARSAALYVFDTLKLSEQWQVSAGGRFDYFEAEQLTKATGISLDRIDRVPTWNAGILYKPAPNGSVYVNYSNSFNPGAENLTLSTAANNAANINTKPELTDTYEIGTKWDLLNERLSLTGALFRIVKTNARTVDPTDAVPTVSVSGEQRVQGIELGATGRITDRWQVYSGLVWLESRITKSDNAAEVGHNLARTPELSFSVWTTYDILRDLQVGAGASYVDSMHINTTNPHEISGYWLFDAMANYQLTDNVAVRLNAYNLFNEFYIASAHGGGAHIVPGPGRAAVLTTSFKF